MNEEQVDFFEKLILIEREANRLADELPPGVSRSRAEYIATVAGLLKARLDVFGRVILPPSKKPGQR